MKQKINGNLSALLEAFFTDRLIGQRQVSPHTIASYRDTFRLILQYTRQRLKKAPADLALTDLDASLVVAFLEYVERDRGNSARTRNLRLAAIHSFFRYVSFQEPALADHIQRVLAIPSKRYKKALVTFLIRPEIDALLSSETSPHRLDRF
jgi:site-specific recombinase XerD